MPLLLTRSNAALNGLCSLRYRLSTAGIRIRAKTAAHRPDASAVHEQINREGEEHDPNGAIADEVRARTPVSDPVAQRR